MSRDTEPHPEAATLPCMRWIAVTLLGIALGWTAHAQVNQTCVGIYPGMSLEVEDDLLNRGLCTRMLTIEHIVQYRRLLAGHIVNGVDPEPDL